MLEAKIAKYGNSLTVRLPANLARDLDLREGDRVTLSRSARGLVIEPLPRARLETRLATVKQTESEVGAGRAHGAERFD